LFEVNITDCAKTVTQDFSLKQMHKELLDCSINNVLNKIIAHC